MSLTKVQITELKKNLDHSEEKLPSIFHALADLTRCRIFKLLLVTEHHTLTVTDMGQVIGVSTPAISQHLKVMENAGLIKKSKKGQTVFYGIRNREVIVKLLIKILNSNSTHK